MFSFTSKHKSTRIKTGHVKDKVSALDKFIGVIEFNPDGMITDVNDQFLSFVKYNRDEIIGKHHSILVDKDYAMSDDYQSFWSLLCIGRVKNGQFKRVDAHGKSIYLDASYSPVFDSKNNLIKIVKLATDITKSKKTEFLHEEQMRALNGVLGVVEFDLNGIILSANKNFLDSVGYSEFEMVGKHHSLIVPNGEISSFEYRQFWDKLSKGSPESGVFKRISKQGKDVWMQASFTTVFDEDGNPVKVIKYATDITQSMLKKADSDGQVDAIKKLTGVIEFDLNGYITDVNQNFLDVVGYSKDEVINKHHKLFVDREYASSLEYHEFWDALASGEFKKGTYKRLNKSGTVVWLRATYTPIFDMSGKPFKVVKYATDISTDHFNGLDSYGQLKSINRALGSIEFSMDGFITKVNDNFADIVGLEPAEIIGQHHSMFVPPNIKHSEEYKEFWNKLNRGEFDSGTYQRVGRDNKLIWLNASYNPILDGTGKPVKVVKFAQDVTRQKLLDDELKSTVSDIGALLESASHGDLSNRIDLIGKTEQVSHLSRSVNSFFDNMSVTVDKVRDAGDAINHVSSDISEGNADIALRAERHAQKLKETSETMQSLAGMVKNNSDDAKRATMMALKASEIATHGGEMVAHVEETMSAIHESARRIEEIISVIDGIAFQTNILALNAAVEAARAGEHGRGFAVVANEVRSLSQRSAMAAKDVKELIQNSVDKTVEGKGLVNSASYTMKSIVSSVKDVSDIISGISESSHKQSIGIDAVNSAIIDMDADTQHHFKLVDKNAEISSALVKQVDNLNNVLSKFKTGNEKNNDVQSNIIDLTSQLMANKSPFDGVINEVINKPVVAQKPIVRRKVVNENSWDGF